jgi:hypothetical protein
MYLMLDYNKLPHAQEGKTERFRIWWRAACSQVSTRLIKSTKI